MSHVCYFDLHVVSWYPQILKWLMIAPPQVALILHVSLHDTMRLQTTPLSHKSNADAFFTCAGILASVLQDPAVKANAPLHQHVSNIKGEGSK